MPRYSQRSLESHPEFKGAAKPVPEHRYPRGYTPERQAAVSSALSKAPVDVRHHAFRGVASPYLSSSEFFTYHGGDAPATGPGSGVWSRSNAEVHEAQSQQAHALHTDAIARSTVPLEHLEGLPSIRVGQHLSPGTLGSYTNPGIGDILKGDPHAEAHGRIDISSTQSRKDVAHTLIHELGHHLDYQADPTMFGHRSSFDRKNTRGGGQASPGLEGYAEGYAQGHTVHKGGGGAERLAYSEFVPEYSFAERYHEASGGLKAHEHSSLQKRVSPTSPAQFEPHLFMRDADINVTETQKDFGQHPLVNTDTGEALGTIKVGRGVPRPTPPAEGFRYGDTGVVQDLRSGNVQRRMSVDLPTRRRVAKVWNEKQPSNQIRP